VAPAKKGGEAAVSPMEEWVARARGIGLVLGFAITFWVCRGQGFVLADAVLRGLVGAAILSVVAWWSALLIIQALMRAAVAQAQREAALSAAPRAEAAEAPAPRVAPVPDEAG
jgi:hypothetical protein